MACLTGTPVGAPVARSIHVRRRVRPPLLSVTGLALLSLGLPAQAQEGTGTPTRLEAITVLGTGLETSVLESPASVSVVDSGTLRRIAPESVASYLEGVPGVQIQESGLRRIRIRGETARRVQVKIDGQALTDQTTYGQPLLVDPLNIERIEIVRGSSSVISGSNAIGGVVNIITKRGAPDRAAEVTVQGGYFGATEGTRGSVSVGGTVGAFDYRLTAGRSDRGDRRTPDGTLDPSSREDESLAAHLGFRITPNQYVMLKAQRFDLAADVFTGDPAFRIDLPRRDLTKLAGFYEGTGLAPWLPRLTFDAYTQTIDREFTNDIDTGSTRPLTPRNVRGDSVDEERTHGVNLAAELAVLPVGRTYVGLEYEDDTLTADRLSTVTLNPPPLPPFLPPADPIVSETASDEEASIETLSAYFEQEIVLAETLTGFVGGRYYSVDASLDRSTRRALSSNDDDRFLGSAALVWTPVRDLAFRLNVSQGYSYPALSQLFLTTTAGGSTVVGNPDLKPETSTTFEIGARWNGPGTVVDATAFYSEADDFIETARVDSRTLSYVNVNEVTSYGVELYAETRLGGTGLSPYVSGSLIRRELRYGNGFETADSGTPEVFGRVGVKYDWAIGGVSGIIDAYAHGESPATLRGDDGAVIDRADGYTLLDIDAEIALSDRARLTLGLNNLFNRSYEPFERDPGEKRSVDAFLTITF